VVLSPDGIERFYHRNFETMMGIGPN